jgi:hypothetical protein
MNIKLFNIPYKELFFRYLPKFTSAPLNTILFPKIELVGILPYSANKSSQPAEMIYSLVGCAFLVTKGYPK